MAGDTRTGRRETSEAFVLWLEREPSAGAALGLAGTIEHLGSGSRVSFHDIAELLTFLANALAKEGERSG